MEKTNALSWWNKLSIRAKWDLFYEHNPMVADSPANIRLNLDDIYESHIEEIWYEETETNNGITKLTKRLEAEINKTPSGELRNLLCDANIIIQSLINDNNETF